MRDRCHGRARLFERDGSPPGPGEENQGNRVDDELDEPKPPWPTASHMRDLEKRLIARGKPLADCAPSKTCKPTKEVDQCWRDVVGCIWGVAGRLYATWEEKCHESHYAPCPTGCFRQCVPSSCSGEGRDRGCTADCDGAGSCVCPKVGELLAEFGIKLEKVAAPRSSKDAGANERPKKPPFGSCERECLDRNAMRAVWVETIRADCIRSCDDECRAWCKERFGMGGDAGSRECHARCDELFRDVDASVPPTPKSRRVDPRDER